ncbi:Uncharacterised protein [Klebsiella pneumoniae subsp. ozaenae]|uniref:Uncharacterized protein n=1 Tax=Klebsiella pneumoniae subsp. ozaenae TaxID=574 RepID=A0A378AYD5_KLEPO|nr:Uncharacterised protein [Klebsiella pneumoniae subsp. ozaenae]
MPDGGYALSGLRSPVYQTVTHTVGPAQAQRRRASCTKPRSRRCAGWRLRLIRPTEPCISNGYSHRRPAQAQRRRASCTKPRSRRCAGWRLRLIRPTEPCISNGYSHRRPAQAQRRRASCTRLRSRRYAGWRLRLIRPTFTPALRLAPAGGFPSHRLSPLIHTTIRLFIALLPR